ncbi:unnamed protein product [Rhizophagus irregularis]|nr:unnamed protein product [Rhizophagus irregularis]
MEIEILSESKKCSGCQQTRSFELFSGLNKTYSTCLICRNQKKAIRDNRKRERKEIECQIVDLIEYDELMNEYLSIFKEFKDGDRENKENGLDFKKTLNIMMLNDNSSKNIAEGIIEQISDADNFNWRFHYEQKIIKKLVFDINVLKDTKLGETRYKRDSNTFLSAKALLEEYNCIKILEVDFPVQAIAFETGLYQMLIKNNILIKEFGIDATYNTNNLGFELYVIHAEVNGTGFPLAYLFLENNGKCGDGIRTEIITKFVSQLKEKGLDPEFILTDKDWSQIKACHSTWPKAKIQLCR